MIVLIVTKRRYQKCRRVDGEKCLQGGSDRREGGNTLALVKFLSARVFSLRGGDFNGKRRV